MAGSKGKGKDRDDGESSTGPIIGYMHHEVIKYFYRELNKSEENAVNRMWNNILPLYFPISQGFGVESQGRLDKATKNKADFSVLKVRNGQATKILLMEDRRVLDETSNTVWSNAIAQLTEYLTTARDDNINPVDTVYGIVTIGHHSRFYELLGGEAELRDYPGYGGHHYHFKKDEIAIDGFLYEVANYCQQE